MQWSTYDDSGTEEPTDMRIGSTMRREAQIRRSMSERERTNILIDSENG